jgi:hypothetical protein
MKYFERKCPVEADQNTYSLTNIQQGNVLLLGKTLVVSYLVQQGKKHRFC